VVCADRVAIRCGKTLEEFAQIPSGISRVIQVK
jgi:hypothetical protein